MSQFQRTDAEQAVIKSLLMQPEYLEQIRDLLQPKYFSDDRNREVFEAICGNKLESAQGTQLQDEIAGIKAEPSHIRYYAEAIVEGWKREQIVIVADEILRAAQEGTTPADEVMALGQEKLGAL